MLTRGKAQSGAGVCACSFLEVGQAFEGSQHVSHGVGAKDEAWNVKVRVQGCDMERGYVCGVMEALNVPTAESKVMTFWEGEVVDNVNHNFYTSKWGADRESDIKHWNKFPHFAKLRESVHRDGGRDADLSELPCIFMRWKEKFFVNVGPDCGLTIAGFYYICLVRSSGEVKGYYFDPSSSPYQKLELRASYEDCQGKGFPTYEFH